jgi:hypothetical protein
LKLEVHHRCAWETQRRHSARSKRDISLPDNLVRIKRKVRNSDQLAEDAAAENRGSAEAHVVAPKDPAHKHDRERVKAHDGRIQGPFFLDQTAIQNRKSGNALQSDKRCGSQLPCRITRI